MQISHSVIDALIVEATRSVCTRRFTKFMKTLGPLSNGCYLDTGRFDVLDVTETEIKLLAEMAEKATRPVISRVLSMSWVGYALMGV